jgi:L-iditol 2-dehydrogenase
MRGKMKVAVMTALNKMDYIERDIPEPGPDEVLVKLEYADICGSDMRYYETGRIGDY